MSWARNGACSRQTRKGLMIMLGGTCGKLSCHETPAVNAKCAWGLEKGRSSPVFGTKVFWAQFSWVRVQMGRQTTQAKPGLEKSWGALLGTP